jgi:hypothetical protein
MQIGFILVQAIRSGGNIEKSNYNYFVFYDSFNAVYTSYIIVMIFVASKNENSSPLAKARETIEKMFALSRHLTRKIVPLCTRPFVTEGREVVKFHICLIGENAFVSECPKQVGDYVEANDPVVLIETRKLVIEVCAPVPGKLVEKHVNVGDRIENQHLFSIEKYSRATRE